MTEYNTMSADIPAQPVADAVPNVSHALEQASRDALAAALTGDLLALAVALEVRAHAIDQGEQPTVEVFAMGEETRTLLEDFRRLTGLETARLKQMQDGFSLTSDSAEVSGYVNFRG